MPPDTAGSAGQDRIHNSAARTTDRREYEGNWITQPHEWVKHEPVTAGARPVWVCERCRQYRTQEPAPYNLGECPEVIRYAD